MANTGNWPVRGGPTKKGENNFDVNDLIYCQITFATSNREQVVKMVNANHNKNLNLNIYSYNEIFFYRAIRNYITGGVSIQQQQLLLILNSFGSESHNTFLRALYDIWQQDNIATVSIVSFKAKLVELCAAAQQDNMHDFYDSGRTIVANFKKLAQKYINHGAVLPGAGANGIVSFNHLKEGDFSAVGLKRFCDFKENHHKDGKFAIDTISEEHKRHFNTLVEHAPPPTFLNNEKGENSENSKVSVLLSSTIDGTGSTIKTDSDTEFDCFKELNIYYPAGGPGSIEMAIYSIGAIAYASMFDLVCYDNKGNIKYMFYPHFKFIGDDNKKEVSATKTIMLVLTKLDVEGRVVGIPEEIQVNNRTFTVDNVTRDVNKVYNVISKIAYNPENWYYQLPNDKLFKAILRLCAPYNLIESLQDVIPDGQNRPNWDDVKHFIKNAEHLYTKIKILGKGLGDFGQAFTTLVLNKLSKFQPNFIYRDTNVDSGIAPSKPTTPLALITIDKFLAKICYIIGTYFILSSPGFYLTDPDIIYEQNKALILYHNYMNSVRIFLSYDDSIIPDLNSIVFMNQKQLAYVHHKGIGLHPDIENDDLYEGIKKRTLEQNVNNVNAYTANLNLAIKYDNKGHITGELTLPIMETTTDAYVPPQGRADLAPLNNRGFVGKLLANFVILEDELKKIIKNKAIENFKIIYFPNEKEGKRFKLKYLESGTFNKILSDTIDEYMYKPLRQDVRAFTDGVAHTGPINPFDPLKDIFSSSIAGEDYWKNPETADSTWKAIVRERRIEMIKNFDATNGLNILLDAYIAYISYKILSVKKHTHLHQFISYTCEIEKTPKTISYLNKTKEGNKGPTYYLDIVKKIKNLKYSFSNDGRDRFNKKDEMKSLLVEHKQLQDSDISIKLQTLMDFIERPRTVPETRELVIKSNGTHRFGTPNPTSAMQQDYVYYEKMIEAFKNLLDQFKKSYDKGYKTGMARHSVAYNDLSLDIKTIYKILLCQCKDAENLKYLYSCIQGQGHSCYTKTKDDYRALLLSDVLERLKDVLKMLIKAKKYYFTKLDIFENYNNFTEHIKKLKYEINGGDEAHGSGDENMLYENDDVLMGDDDANIIVVEGDPELSTAEKKAIIISKVELFAHIFNKELDDEVKNEVLNDMEKGRQEKEKCEVFIKISKDLEDLKSEYLNACVTLTYNCLKSSREGSNGNVKITKDMIKAIKDRKFVKDIERTVKDLFTDLSFREAVKFHINFCLLLELEDRILVSIGDIKNILDAHKVSQRVGGNRKKHRSRMKGGNYLIGALTHHFNDNLLDKMIYKFQARNKFLTDSYVPTNEEDDEEQKILQYDLEGLNNDIIEAKNIDAFEKKGDNNRLRNRLMNNRSQSPVLSDSMYSSFSSASTNDGRYLQMSQSLPDVPEKESIVKKNKRKANEDFSENIKRQKIGGGRKPKVESKIAKTEAKKPKVESKIAKTEAKKPKTESKIAKTEAKKPKTESKIAKAEAKKPKAEAKKPKSEAKKPKAEAKKPKAEVKKPKAEAKKPKAEAKKGFIT